MTHASIFSGIGGPEVAAAMLGWDNLFHCEINEFGRKVLDYWFPNSKSYEDITKTDFSEWRGKVDVLTGGFPCQPFSYAGKRRGADDDRYLWPYMFRCIDQIRPDWVVAENVAGITTMVEQGEVLEMGCEASMFEEVDGLHRYRLTETFTLQRICDDLESHGYSVQPVLVPACAVGAPHRRDRVFIVANRSVMQCDRSESGKRGRQKEISELGDNNSKGISTADSDNGADRRIAREYEGESGKERLQERHEVRKPDEPNQVRPEMRGLAPDPCDNERDGLCRVAGQKRPFREERENGKIISEEGHGMDLHTDIKRFGEYRNASNTDNKRLERTASQRVQGYERRRKSDGICECPWDYSKGFPTGRWDSFPTVSPVHRGNDGLPFDVDRLAIPFGKWRTEALKAYGNAIVPQVMYEIFRFIEIVEKGEKQ